MRFYEETDYGSNKNDDFQKGIVISRAIDKSPRVATPSFAGGVQAVFGFDVARMLKGLLSEILFGNKGVKIPTYVRNDNSTAVYQVDSANTVTNAKRLNNFLESNREELENTDWLSSGYIPGAANTSDGLTKSMTGAKLRRLFNENISQIVTENQEGEIRKRLPSAKHYIAYPETKQGQKDLNHNTRLKTRV